MLFLDTTELVGAADPRDVRHADGKAVLTAVGTGILGTALVSDLVLAETLTILGKGGPRGAQAGAALVEKLLASPRTRCLHLDDQTLLDVLPVYLRFGGKLSFTDAASVMLMRKHECETIFSHDSDFDKVAGITRKQIP